MNRIVSIPVRERHRRILPRLIVAALIAAMLVPAVGSAEVMRRGIFQGTMVGFDGTPSNGLLHAKTDDGKVQDCGYDHNTYFEYNHERVPITKVVSGDFLDIIVDRTYGTNACYMRIIHVLDVEPRPARDPRKQAAAPGRTTLSLRPTKTIAGIVVRKDSNVATIRGRDGKEIPVTLRAETAYFGDGVKMQASDLVANMRVSIQAATAVGGQVEAVQVTWGTITGVNTEGK